MPKQRKKPGTRKLEKHLFIICEGKKDKSEYAYFDKLIANCKFEGEKVQVEVIDTKKNTGKELVKEAIKNKKFPEDIAWVVYDKDGYTKHNETFELARAKNIKIGFSSISFEYWILIHFEYTTKSYEKSDEIISYIKRKYFPEYSKSSSQVYNKTKDKLSIAKSNANKIRKYQEKNNFSHIHIYDLNPYTNLDELVEEIESLQDL